MENQPQTEQVALSLCPACHQQTLPEYYFCPNCGKELRLPPLLTTPQAQALLYAFSIILPSLCFIFIKNWKGLRYLRSSNQQEKTIGIIACSLLVISTVITFWYTYTITQKLVQEAMTGMTADMNDF